MLLRPYAITHCIPADELEENDLAGELPQLVESLWKQLNITLMTKFVSRTPPELLGPCNEQCASTTERP